MLLRTQHQRGDQRDERHEQAKQHRANCCLGTVRQVIGSWASQLWLSRRVTGISTHPGGGAGSAAGHFISRCAMGQGIAAAATVTLSGNAGRAAGRAKPGFAGAGRVISCRLPR
jgi:hypothetical protein